MKKFLIILAACVTLSCGALALAACFDKTEYSVTCRAGENGYVIASGKSAKAGEKIILAAHPDAGYKLSAYLLDGEVLDGVSFVMPEKDVTVSARFEAVTYSVTYVLNGATVSGGNPETYTVENAAELIQPEKEGYEVCGWYRYRPEPEYGIDWYIEDFKVTSLEGLYGNLTLYAMYYNPPHEINISDYANGNVYVEGYMWEGYFGDTVNLVVEPYYGYELDYITVNGNTIEGTSFVMPAEDVTVTVKFRPVRYSITYELDDGVNAPENPDFYTVEDDYIIFGDAEKEGYVFQGWYYDLGYGKLFLYDSTYYVSDLQDITLYAYFEPEEEEELYE